MFGKMPWTVWIVWKNGSLAFGLDAYNRCYIVLWFSVTRNNEKSAWMRHKHCALAVVRWSQKLLPRHKSPSQGHGNRPTHTPTNTHTNKQTNRTDYNTLHCSLVRSVITRFCGTCDSLVLPSLLPLQAQLAYCWWDALAIINTTHQ